MSKKTIIKIGIIIVATVVLAVVGMKIYRTIVGDPLVLYGNVDIRTVNLSFRVSGKLNELKVDEGDAIKPEEILARLDPQPYEHALAQATAQVGVQKAQLALMEEGYRVEEIAQVRSEVRERQVSYDYAEINLQRQQKLYSTRAISADELDSARTSRNEAKAALQAAQQKLTQYETGNRIQEIEKAKANLQQAQAALAQTQLNLEDTILKSPSGGTILTRAVEPGSMLAAGNTVLTLSLVRPVWVRAYVDEVNLGAAVPGTEVEVFTDGKPNKPYKGSIGFVSPTAEFTPKTVQTPDLRTDLVYRLRIIIDNPDDNLRQGMPVTIKFP